MASRIINSQRRKTSSSEVTSNRPTKGSTIPFSCPTQHTQKITIPKKPKDMMTRKIQKFYNHVILLNQTKVPAQNNNYPLLHQLDGRLQTTRGGSPVPQLTLRRLQTSSLRDIRLITAPLNQKNAIDNPKPTT